LLWNVDDQRIKEHLGEYLRYKSHSDQRFGNKIVNYIRDAEPRISIEGNEKATHFELMDFLKRLNSEFKEIVEVLSSVMKIEKKVIDMFRAEFYHFLLKKEGSCYR
jgi:ferritin